MLVKLHTHKTSYHWNFCVKGGIVAFQSSGTVPPSGTSSKPSTADDQTESGEARPKTRHLLIHQEEVAGQLRWWITRIWLVVSKMFYFHPYLGKIPSLTNIFQGG